jgi:hypothetical protein
VNDESEGVLRMIEHTGATLRLAAERFAQGASADESLTLTAEAIGDVVLIDPATFVGMSPPSMVTLLEASALDDRLVSRVAESLLLEADIMQSEGDLIGAAMRREQASAVLDAIDPARAN